MEGLLSHSTQIYTGAYSQCLGEFGARAHTSALSVIMLDMIHLSS